MSKQQTALNWFVNQKPPRALEDVYDLLQQALEMEKQQIEDAYEIGFADAWDDARYDDEPLYKNAEQYYNETYGNE